MKSRTLEPWLVLGVASLAIHLIFNGGYGIFRDELYFIVCGDRPAWGYVDQPPLIPLLASWSHALFGQFLVGFRLIPAIALSVGPMLNGWWRGERTGSGTIVWKAREMMAKGEVDYSEIGRAHV